MPLVICDHGPLNVPTILCDACGEPITSASEGNYQWVMPQQGTGSPVFYTHKHCCDRFERRTQGKPLRIWEYMPPQG